MCLIVVCTIKLVQALWDATNYYHHKSDLRLVVLIWGAPKYPCHRLRYWWLSPNPEYPHSSFVSSLKFHKIIFSCTSIGSVASCDLEYKRWYLILCWSQAVGLELFYREKSHQEKVLVQGNGNDENGKRQTAEDTKNVNCEENKSKNLRGEIQDLWIWRLHLSFVFFIRMRCGDRSLHTISSLFWEVVSPTRTVMLLMSRRTVKADSCSIYVQWLAGHAWEVAPTYPNHHLVLARILRRA